LLGNVERIVAVRSKLVGAGHPGLIICRVSKKSGKIAGMIDAFQGRDLDAHYIGFFACFNDQLFYESHDVLEELWLSDRHGPEGDFYKGLIQLAGAFVHLQKDRLGPAAALFKLARANLGKYPLTHARLNVSTVLALIELWLGWLESAEFKANPLKVQNAPRLELEGELV
jgi:predicted metal-dependent hydrolase